MKVSKNVRPWINRARRWLNNGWEPLEKPVFDIEALPKLILLTILNGLPLVELIELRKVSHKWKILAATSFKARRSLTLLIGDGAKLRNGNFSQRSIFNLLSTGKGPLTKRGTDFLFEHLPNISSLTIVMRHATEVQIGQLVRIVIFWARNLTELNILIDFGFTTKQQTSDSTQAQLLYLIAALNLLPSIKHLQIRLLADLFPVDSVRNFKLELPILARLETFTFRSFDKANILEDSLLNYTQSNLHLNLLGIFNWYNKDSAIRLLQLKPSIAQNFQRLHLSEWAPSPDQLERFASHFPNLRFLILHLDSFAIPLPALSRFLRPLKNLQSLQLFVTGLTAHLGAIEEELLKLEPGNHRILEALPSVRNFGFGLLNGSFTCHSEFAYLHLHQMLPNLKKMFIYGDLHECAVCGDFGRVYRRHERSKDWRRVEKCILQQMVEPIQGCFSNDTDFRVLNWYRAIGH